MTITEEGREAPEPERYYTEHVQLPFETEGSPLVVLQKALNEGARQSWRLVGVVKAPTGEGGVLLTWDTEGFFSG